jgi:hypothetical protein
MSRRCHATLKLMLLVQAVTVPSSLFGQRPPEGLKPGDSRASTATSAGPQTNVPTEVLNLQKHTRSHIQLESHNRLVDVYLFAADEQVEVLEDSYCGGDKGDRQFSGHYQLVSVVGNAVVSKLDLDPDVNFVEKKPHDGAKLYRDQKTGQDLLALFQYGTCNSETVQFFLADPSGRLYSIPFLDRDGRTRSHQVTGPTGAIPHLSDGSSVFCAYANAVQCYFCDAYLFDGANFQGTTKWMTRELSDPLKGLNTQGQAMRALSDFLSLLSAKDYRAAAYYFLGYLALAGTTPATTSPAEKAKMLEAYCTKQGGQCLMPLKIDGSGSLDAQGAMPFTVSFQTSDFEPFQLNGRSSFEFRIWKTPEGFKVLDLPPHIP